MQVTEVVHGSRRQESAERHRSQFWMHSMAGQIVRLKVQCLQCGQILCAQAGELVEELLDRFTLTLFHLRKAVCETATRGVTERGVRIARCHSSPIEDLKLSLRQLRPATSVMCLSPRT